MSAQSFVNFQVVDGAARTQTQEALESDGFQVAAHTHPGGAVLAVRIREGTGDRARAEQVVRGLAPDASLAGQRTPAALLHGYRQGR